MKRTRRGTGFRQEQGQITVGTESQGWGGGAEKSVWDVRCDRAMVLGHQSWALSGHEAGPCFADASSWSSAGVSKQSRLSLAVEDFAN